jgi:acyl-CoA synthetase (AMP-forming)/AMP-acid ligase II
LVPSLLQESETEMSSATRPDQDSISIVLARMRGLGDRPALIHRETSVSYQDFTSLIDRWVAELSAAGIGRHSVCAVFGDFTPDSCAVLWALMLIGAVAVPLSPATGPNMVELQSMAGAEYFIRPNDAVAGRIETLATPTPNALLESFRARNKPGLVVFTSGSTGKPKGILHDFERVVHKFVAERTGWRTVLFLMFDHFGGINTMLSTFAYGGVGVCLEQRLPDVVCRAVQSSRATLLPTTPTFLNLMLASNVYRAYDLSSVQLITYGTEVMPAATLEKIQVAFPKAQIKQTYGLSELGVLRSKSESDNSTWVKIGGDGFEVKIKDNLLFVRSEANMIGYLNAPNPFDSDGWLCTFDEVEVRGEYMRILGRKSDLINVGGQKVYPSEIETVLLEADNVVEAVVMGVPHPILGNAIHARITIAQPEDGTALTERLRTLCIQRLARFKVPMRFIVATEQQHSARFKKIRS